MKPQPFRRSCRPWCTGIVSQHVPQTRDRRRDPQGGGGQGVPQKATGQVTLVEAHCCKSGWKGRRIHSWALGAWGGWGLRCPHFPLNLPSWITPKCNRTREGSQVPGQGSTFLLLQKSRDLRGFLSKGEVWTESGPLAAFPPVGALGAKGVLDPDYLSPNEPSWVRAQTSGKEGPPLKTLILLCPQLKARYRQALRTYPAPSE